MNWVGELGRRSRRGWHAKYRGKTVQGVGMEESPFIEFFQTKRYDFDRKTLRWRNL